MGLESSACAVPSFLNVIKYTKSEIKDVKKPILICKKSQNFLKSYFFICPIKKGFIMTFLPHADATVTGTLTAIGQTVALDLHAHESFTIFATGGEDSANLVEGSADGVVFFAVNYITYSQAGLVLVQSPTSINDLTGGVFRGHCTGLKKLRIRQTANLGGSDTTTVTITASAQSLEPFLPVNASTANLQVSGNTLLQTLDGKIKSPLDTLFTTSFSNFGNFVIPTNNHATATLQTSGSSGVQIGVEGTIDGANWVPLQMLLVNTNTFLTSSVVNGIFKISIGGFTSIRVRVVDFNAGTKNVSVTLSIRPTHVTTQSLAPLPAGSNLIGNVNNLIDGNVPALGAGNVNGQTQRVQLANESLSSVGTSSVQLQSASQHPFFRDFGTTSLTTTYTEIVASVSSNVNALEFFNGTNEPIFIATGLIGSEIVRYIIPPGGSTSFAKLLIPTGSRITMKAATTTITSGLFIINALS